MIVYSATKSVFSQDVLSNQIEDKIYAAFKKAFGHNTSRSEIRSWKQSMVYMNNICLDAEIPEDAGVAIEYRIPQTAKRIDFILTGRNAQNKNSAILVELKQWESAEKTDKDGIVRTFVGRGNNEVSHPSYQAWTYAALIDDFNEAVRENDITLKPCAYLHNYVRDDVITNSFYQAHLEKAPVFLKDDTQKLQSFIKQFVKYGDKNNLLYFIENGRIRPSKNLADKLLSLLKGNQEFIMIDDQKVVFETAIALSKQSAKDKKNVLIVEGGPGTGKSVVAVNLLVRFIEGGLNARYVTKNLAPRIVYESKLTGSFTKSHITNLFTGSGAFTATETNAFDVLIVDEAHRLNEKSGMFQNKGENQIKEIINSSALSVFFIDEDQRVTLKDIGEVTEIERWAKRYKAKVQKLSLESQFRCNGADGYLAWLDNALQIRATANETLEGIHYDFRIIDDPNELKRLIEEKNKLNNKARLVAGYCWEWASKKAPTAYDIELPAYSFRARWNLATDGNLWILKPEAVKEIGCIHTCQGLEVDYVGVIVGDDLVARDDTVGTDAAKRARMDASVKGYKKRLKEDERRAKAEMDSIIKNTYRTLMTRGAKGCYVYFCDKETERYFKSCLGTQFKINETLHVSDIITPEEESLLGIKYEIEKALQFTEYLPVFSVEAACGQFGDGQLVEKDGWIKATVFGPLKRNMYVVQAKGASMEPSIKDGDYCIFRSPVVGSRNEKIVLIQHNSVEDSEYGGKYTIKKYTSKKSYGADDSWTHEQIVLQPTNSEYQPIILKESDVDSFLVVGEFVGVVR
ncbi:MAG: DUF2075 domain-containing protein [Candidatus Omnitrophota bacterium]|nr:DUF2075 domain-containing protein [Candidatus Omnitrophota bacterium]